MYQHYVCHAGVVVLVSAHRVFDPKFDVQTTIDNLVLYEPGYDPLIIMPVVDILTSVCIFFEYNHDVFRCPGADAHEF